MTQESLDAETRALLALNLTEGIGQTLTQRLVEQFGSAAAAVDATPRAWAEIHRLSLERARKLHGALKATLDGQAVDQECDRLDAHQVTLISIQDARYPRLLRMIPDPPQLLWVRGELHEHDAVALGIVGSRRCTHYGREQADRFASHAAQAGLCVVSGGAHGIDAAAHRAAMRHEGRTIAVIGSGLANPYPKAHRELFDQIAEPGAERGAVISELPMTVAPHAENFPRRNRIISGLALGVLVVEAATRSGALITARLCVEDHGRELLAVPGRVDSAASDGCHRMIREGWARLVTGGADMLDALGETGQLLKSEMMQTPAGDGEDNPSESPAARAENDGSNLFTEQLTAVQQTIMGALKQPCTLDQLVAATDLPTHQIQSELTLLELQGHVTRTGGLLSRRR